MGAMPPRQRLSVGAAIAIPTLALLGVAVFTALDLVGQQPQPRGPATLLSPTPERTYSKAPEDQVRNVHRALHRIGDECSDPGPGTEAVVAQEASVILDFARRHPDARFEIDDESGTPLALLLVLRDELPACAPALVPRVEDLLPGGLREPSGATA